MEHRPYFHRVQYYETDQMAVAHHSNYIRWLEEARTALLLQNGIRYRDMEEQGIIIPVVDISCRYLISARYDDVMEIYPSITKYNGVRLEFSYEIRFQHDGRLAATAHSSHCFIGQNHKPMALQKINPILHQAFLSLAEK